MHKTRGAIVLLGAAIWNLPACVIGDDPAEVRQSELAGDHEVPPVATTATGQANARFRGGQLDVYGEFSGLESDLLEVAGSSAHVHEGGLDVAGPVVFNLDVSSEDNRSGVFMGTFDLDDAQIELFERGLLYVNIHTEDNPAGELRAQLMDDPPELAPIDTSFDAMFEREQTAAATPSDAEGMARAILRERDLIVSGSFENLSSPLMDVDDLGSVHIHEAPPGEAGPVVFPLDVVPEGEGLSGRFSARLSLTREQVEALMNGNYYVNIHTEQFPDGEIRGQLERRR